MYRHARPYSKSCLSVIFRNRSRCFSKSSVVRQNSSRGPKRGGSKPEYDYRLDTARRLWRGRTRVRGGHIYIRTSGKSIRTRPLDGNDGAVHRVARKKGPDPKLQNESCRQVSPSQVRDACGPHDGNKHTQRAIASDGVHSAQQCGPADLADSFPPNAPRCHFAMDFGMKFAWE